MLGYIVLRTRVLVPVAVFASTTLIISPHTEAADLERFPQVQTQSDGTAVFVDDFEGPGPIWTADGLWHKTTYCAASSSGHSTPTAYFFGDDGVCTFNTGVTVQGSLTSPLINFGAADSTLLFNYLLGTEQLAGWDIATVEIGTDAGGWSLLDQDVAHGGGLDDSGASWLQATYDTSAWAGQSAQLRFSFYSIDSVDNDFAGFYIDDVQLYVSDPAAEIFDDGFESGDTSAWTGVAP